MNEKTILMELKTLVNDQNIAIVGMATKVDLMWKAFVGGIGLLLLTVAGAILALVVKG